MYNLRTTHYLSLLCYISTISPLLASLHHCTSTTFPPLYLYHCTSTTSPPPQHLHYLSTTVPLSLCFHHLRSAPLYLHYLSIPVSIPLLPPLSTTVQYHCAFTTSPSLYLHYPSITVSLPLYFHHVSTFTASPPPPPFHTWCTQCLRSPQ